MKYTALLSDRLRFVPWDKSFAPAWEPFFKDPKALAFLAFDAELSSLEKAEFWIDKQLERYRKKEFGHLALFDWQAEKLVGSAGILLREIEGEQYHEIAYSILPQFWGKGYAGEAARTLIKFAQKHLDADQLVSIIDLENHPSIQVAKKIGFKELRTIDFEGEQVYLFGADLKKAH